MNISVIIPVRDRWQSVRNTLQSLDQQRHLPFEVIVIDDGSVHPAPENLGNSMARCQLQIIRQAALGIAAARNNGIAVARGEIILFTDSDCVLRPSCIQEVVRCAADHRESVAFQLAFVPTSGRFVWRVDGIGKSSKQIAVRTASGHIKSLDTGGFAIRRAYSETKSPLFDATHIRGEDTALLTALIAEGHLPRFVEAAHVEHRPVQGLGRYFIRKFQAGYRASPARTQLRAAPGILLNSRGRSVVLRAAWTTARKHQMGVACVFVLLACYVFELGGRLLYTIIGMRPGRIELLGLPLNCLHSAELESRVLSAAESHHPTCITYLTAWSMVQAQTNPQFKNVLHRFDAVYADGMGVVIATFLLHFRRVKKVTANNFFLEMCQESACRNLGLALIGGTPAVIELTRERLLAAAPNLRIVWSSSGYIAEPQAEVLLNGLTCAQPHLVVLAMGQPLQETIALHIRERFPRCAILCVGGLFDYIAGVNSTPPKPVRRLGFEWLWRLVHSPRRTWKRYLMGIPMLFGYIVREYLQQLWKMVSGISR